MLISDTLLSSLRFEIAFNIQACIENTFKRDNWRKEKSCQLNLAAELLASKVFHSFLFRLFSFITFFLRPDQVQSCIDFFVVATFKASVLYSTPPPPFFLLFNLIIAFVHIKYVFFFFLKRKERQNFRKNKIILIHFILLKMEQFELQKLCRYSFKFKTNKQPSDRCHVLLSPNFWNKNLQ